MRLQRAGHNWSELSTQHADVFLESEKNTNKNDAFDQIKNASFPASMSHV